MASTAGQKYLCYLLYLSICEFLCSLSQELGHLISDSFVFPFLKWQKKKKELNYDGFIGEIKTSAWLLQRLIHSTVVLGPLVIMFIVLPLLLKHK